MNSHNNVLIFTVYQNDNSNNEANHKEVMSFLKNEGIACKELQRVTIREGRLSILIDSLNYRSLVERLCREFNQDYYIESFGNDRFTKLIELEGKTYDLGYLKPVLKEEALNEGIYYHDMGMDSYYIMKDEF